jgi:hypothetical protein
MEWMLPVDWRGVECNKCNGRRSVTCGQSRPANLARAVAGFDGPIAGAEALQIRRRNSLRPSAIRSVKGLAMDRSNIRDCVLPRLGRGLFRRLFGAANKATYHQQGDECEFSQGFHNLAFLFEGRS